MPLARRIIPCLWFDDQAEDAARFYTEIFPASRITSIRVTVHSSADPGPDGRRDRTPQLLRTASLRTWRAGEIARGIGLDDAQGLRAELGRRVR